MNGWVTTTNLKKTIGRPGLIPGAHSVRVGIFFILNIYKMTDGQVLKQVLSRPIAYHRIYAEITGSITAGLLLSQLCYWQKTKNDEFYKTNEDVCKETGMTINETKGAKKKIKKLPFVMVEVKGIPAKTYYRIDFDLMYDFIKTHTQKAVGGNPTNYLGEIQPANQVESNQPADGNPTNSYTETTTETTTETKKKNIKKKNLDKSSAMVFHPPTEKEVREFVWEKGYSKSIGEVAYYYYDELGWKDKNGKQIRSWKLKLLSVWLKNAEKVPKEQIARERNSGARYMTADELEKKYKHLYE